LRFRDLGGVPRYVFDRDQSHAQVVRSFLNDLPSPNDIVNVLTTKDFTRLEVDRGGRLITYETDTDMQKTDVRWVSDRIGQWAMTAVAKSDERRTMDLLWSMSENPVSGGAFGIAFESYAHLKLAEGGIFDYRLEGDSVTQKLYLKASETTYFDQCNDVPNETYGRPSHKTEESIDAIYQPDKMFQMTVSTTKEVKLNGLTQCVRGMRSANQDFFIVVPQVRYRTFTNVVLSPPGSDWPGSIGNLYVLSISLRSKRKRDELLDEAKEQLKNKQKLDASAVDALLQATNDDDDVATLEINGIEIKQRQHASWTEVGKYPNAHNPALHLFKQKTGAFVAIQR